MSTSNVIFVGADAPNGVATAQVHADGSITVTAGPDASPAPDPGITSLQIPAGQEVVAGGGTFDLTKGHHIFTTGAGGARTIPNGTVDGEVHSILVTWTIEAPITINGQFTNRDGDQSAISVVANRPAYLIKWDEATTRWLVINDNPTPTVSITRHTDITTKNISVSGTPTVVARLLTGAGSIRAFRFYIESGAYPVASEDLTLKIEYRGPDEPAATLYTAPIWEFPDLIHSLGQVGDPIPGIDALIEITLEGAVGTLPELTLSFDIVNAS
jgi:hypothetical protein